MGAIGKIGVATQQLDHGAARALRDGAPLSPRERVLRLLRLAPTPDRPPEHEASSYFVSRAANSDERRRTFLLVRYVLIISVAALAITHAPSALPLSQTLLILWAIGSNLALSRVDGRNFFQWWVQGPVLLGDSLWIAVILLAAGMGQQFFLFYFIELFLAAISESVGLLAVGAVLIGTASLVMGGDGTAAVALIRLPFLFATAIFYGYVVDATKQERRVATEREVWGKQLEAEVAARTEELQNQSNELRTLYQRVVEADRLKSEFVANMSHELRTPLNIIIGYTDIAMDAPELPANAEVRTFLRRIADGAHALHRLLENVLQYAALDRGRAALLITQFPADKLLTDLRNLCADVRNDDEIRTHIDGAPRIEMRTDFERLRAVLSNLVLNAIKFTRHGEVVLTVRADADQLQFRVHDTGIGIPAEELGHIFEPFRQVDGSSTRHFGGVGLGLAIVWRNLELLRGQVEVESRVGVGSTFTVTVPRQLDLELAKY